jgi:hypothetical protein
MSRILILETTPSGFTPYYSGAYTEFSIATGAGKLYQNSGLHEGFVVGMTTNPTKLSDELSTIDLASITFGSGVEIGTVDVRGSGDNYFNGITKAADTLDANTTYHHALYAQLTGSAGIGGGIKTGIVGSGANSTDFANGNYSGIFNTDETIYNFSTTYNTGTQVGSGVHSDKSLSIGLSVIDRTNIEVDSQQELLANPFISGIHIDILNSNGTIAQSGFQSGFKDVSFIFSEEDNQQVFGSYTRNFGVQTRTVSDNGFISTGKFFIYGNRIDISRIRITDGTGQFLDENTINFKAPNTGLTNALPETNRQKISDANISGQIQFQVRLEDKDSRPETISIYGTSGDIDSLTLDSESLLRSFDLKFNPLNIYSFSLTPEDNILANVDYYFKLVPEGFLGTGETWTVGPYRIQAPEIATTNPIMPDVPNQSMRAGLGIGTTSVIESDNSAFIVYADDSEVSSISVKSTGSGAGAVGIGTSNPENTFEVVGLGTTAPSLIVGSGSGTAGVGIGTSQLSSTGNSLEVVGIGSTAPSIAVAAGIGASAGFVGIGSSDPSFPLDASTIEKANIAAANSFIFSTGSAIFGGANHVISGDFNVIAGGAKAQISGNNFNFIGGGTGVNVDHSEYSSSVGGFNNDIFSGDYSVIGGGLSNLISGIAADSHVDKVAIVGGESNKVISAPYTFIGAGNSNLISGTNSLYSSIIGGGFNKIKESQFASILGGDNNTIEFANHSVSAGNYSKVKSGHAGAFVFSDSRTSVYESTGGNTLNLRFESGVFVDTDSGIYINGNPVVTGTTAESDTLQTVTDRGATTTNAISVSNTITNRGLIVQDTYSQTKARILNDGSISGGASFLGTGVEDRITKGGVPYMLSGDAVAPGSVGTLQQVTDNGATTTNAININNSSTIGLTTRGFAISNGMYNVARLLTDGSISGASAIIDNSVGIGTNSPGTNAHLEVYKDNPQIVLTDSNEGTNDKTFRFININEALNITARTDGNTANTAGGDIMTLQRDGKVGIGTNSPERELTVSGRARIWNSANTKYIEAFGGNSANFIDSYNNSLILRYGGDSNKSITLNSAGNVGIGTISPTELLEVDGNIKLGDGGARSIIGPTNESIRILANPNASDEGIAFSTDAGATTGMFIKDGNNVGIGTTNPTETLEVTGDIFINGGPAGGRSLALKRTGATNAWKLVQGHTQTDYLEILEGSDTRFLIKNGGNVGIGTVAPSTKLQTIGTISGSTGRFENAKISNFGASDYAAFGHENVADNSYAIRQHSNGNTHINAGSSRNVEFRGGIGANSTQGGFTAASDFFVGGSSSDNVFYVDRSEESVGIGTVSPSRDLQIGDGSSDSVVAIVGPTAGLSQLALGDTDDDNYGQILVDHSANKLQIQNGGGGAIGNRGITLDSSENVGIGTSSPSAQLTVSGDGIRIISTGTNANNGEARIGVVGNNSRPNFELGPEGNSDEFQIINGGEWKVRTTTARDLTFGTNSTNAIYIEGTNQNVGIGTDSPSVKLQTLGTISGYTGLFSGSVGIGTNDPGSYNLYVSGGGRFTTNVDFSNNYGIRSYLADGSGPIQTLRLNSSNQVCLGPESSNTYATRIAGDYITLEPSNFLGVPVEAVRVIDGGNVGIGTTIPSGNLHIENGASSRPFSTQADELIVESSSHGGISILTPNASRGHLYFNNNAFLRWVGSDDKLSINTSASSTTIAIAESAGNTTFGGNVLGTGNGNRLTTNGTPYLLSGDVAGGGGGSDTLQDVTDNGATTTNSITIGASSSPAQALDIVGYLQMANTRSNNTQKIARQLVPEYNNSHGSFLAFMGTANADSNVVSYGGGTSAADAATEMRFYTASAVNNTIGTERMRITSSGRVGIGTNTPSGEFDVAADTDVSGIIGRANIGYMGQSDSASFSHIDYANAYNYAIKQNSAGNTLINTKTAGTIAFSMNNSTIAAFNNGGDFFVDTDTLFVDASTDKVGIGSNAPAYVLDAVFAGDDGARIRSTDNHASFYIQSAASYGAYIRFGDGANRYWIHNDPNDSLYFRPKGVAPSSNVGVVFDETGRVGIGTSNPDTRLHVKGTAIRFEEAGGSTRHFDIIPATAGVNHKFTSDSTSAGYEFYNNANSLLNLTNTEATFNTSGENIDFRVKSSGSTAIFVDASIGTVGINQSSPSSTYALDVGGSIRMATAAPSLVLRETDSSNQEFSVFGLGGDFFIRDITQSTYPLKIEAGVANDTLVLESGGNVGIGTNASDEKLHIHSGHIKVQSSPVGGVTPPSLKIGQVNNAYQAGLISSTHVTLKSTNGAGEIIFMPANTYKGVIKPNGNMGVNTVTPNSTLHVEGDITGAGDVFGTGANDRITLNGTGYLLSGEAGTEADTLQTVTDRGASTTNAISVLAITGTAGLNQFKGSTADSSANTIIARNSSNTSLFSIRNDGRVDIPVGPVVVDTDTLYVDTSNDRVGINESSPRTQLHVVGNSSTEGGVITVQNQSTSNGSYCGMEFINSSVDYPRSAIFAMRTGGSYDADLTFHTSKLNEITGTDYPTATERMRITCSGRVGIGTDNPTTKLHIHDGHLRLNDTYKIEWGGTNVRIDGSNSTDYLRFFTSDTTRMTIDNNGKVGIGTDSPADTLQVAGQVRIDGSTTDGLTVTSNAGASRGLEIYNNSSTDTASIINYYNGPLLLGQHNTTVITIDNDSVGINVAAPAGDKLMVQAENNYFAARLDGATTAGQSNGLRVRAGYNSTDRPVLIEKANGTDVFIIDGLGNVGIGTAPSNALDVVGHFSATSKSFLIDHPTKENKKLQYASLEGPENGVYVRGTTNSTIIELPDYWSELVHEDSITVVLTPIGKKQDLYIKSKSPENIMVGGVEGSYDYVVYGERKDIDKLEIEPLKV